MEKIKEVFLNSIDSIKENRINLFRGLLVPMLIMVGISVYFPILIKSLDMNMIIILSIVYPIFYFILYVVCFIQISRIVLLNEEKSFLSFLSWGKKEFMFVFYAGLITFASALIVGISLPFFNFEQIFLSVIPLSVIFLVLYTIPRFILLFPATAVEKYISLKESWNLTEDNKFLMIFTCWLLPIFFTVPIFLLLSILPLVLLQTLSVLTMIATVSFSAEAYKLIIVQNLDSLVEKEVK
ncbi:MAG: Unknown protein [uncultured Campylobacterales bacterium]|uniref:Uncharacterized protein n=1 Tax=uncultured Campylobacterales bacterium TaxID=352960 RepID=A0A6S6S0X4_9BACT|nr:MAG: Unknown protein [uncultured Campylobacterales bacterium]